MYYPVDCQSVAAWKLHYYQWAMQIFEQYNLSEAASQFALAALEQVDEALNFAEDSSGVDQLQESANVVRGRLWANVFKFTLDLNNYYDAYCAMISNPDEESKYICLRRFVIVLCERGAVQVGQFMFIFLNLLPTGVVIFLTNIMRRMTKSPPKPYFKTDNEKAPGN